MKTDKVFKVNGHNLKPYYDSFQTQDVENTHMEELDYVDE